MGAYIGPDTMPGGMTPICNECGIALCWDIAKEEYQEDQAFWDAWICEVCNKGVAFSRAHFNSMVFRQKLDSLGL